MQPRPMRSSESSSQGGAVRRGRLRAASIRRCLIPSRGMTEDSLNRVAFSATAHCLTGCAIGEVLGVVIGTALGWSDARDDRARNRPRVLLRLPADDGAAPARRARRSRSAIPLALASDTFSIAVMELVDNGVLLLVPGAMEAGLAEPLFWGSLAFALRRRLRRGVSGEPLAHRARQGSRRRARPPRARVERVSC